MNERIKQLMEQAIETVDDPFPGNPLNDELEKMYIPDCFAEKFAELIVQECVEICASIAAVRAGYNDADGRDTAYSCGDTIKEHFGVEE